jgi:hypothetical protein
MSDRTRYLCAVACLALVAMAGSGLAQAVVGTGVGAPTAVVSVSPVLLSAPGRGADHCVLAWFW